MKNSVKNNISIDKLTYINVYYYNGIYKQNEEYYNFSLYVSEETKVITWEEEVPKNQELVEKEIINKFDVEQFNIEQNNKTITAFEYFQNQSITDAKSVIDKNKHKFTRFELIKFAQAYYNSQIKEI